MINRVCYCIMDLSLILFENQIQTTSASPCRTQVQPTASFLVCSLIFIEYKSTPRFFTKMRMIKMDGKHCKGYQKGV